MCALFEEALAAPKISVDILALLDMLEIGVLSRSTFAVSNLLHHSPVCSKVSGRCALEQRVGSRGLALRIKNSRVENERSAVLVLSPRFEGAIGGQAAGKGLDQRTATSKIHRSFGHFDDKVVRSGQMPSIKLLQVQSVRDETSRTFQC